MHFLNPLETRESKHQDIQKRMGDIPRDEEKIFDELEPTFKLIAGYDGHRRHMNYSSTKVKGYNVLPFHGRISRNHEVPPPTCERCRSPATLDATVETVLESKVCRVKTCKACAIVLVDPISRKRREELDECLSELENPNPGW